MQRLTGVTVRQAFANCVWALFGVGVILALQAAWILMEQQNRVDFVKVFDLSDGEMIQRIILF